MKIKCNRCKGKGMVSIAPYIRGLKECPQCNGTGIIEIIKGRGKKLWILEKQ